MRIGWDKDDKGDHYTHMYQSVGDAWFSTGKMNMIGMIINDSDGPTSAAVTFNVDMNAHIQNAEFYPGSDFVDISGTFNAWGGGSQLSDPDGDGVYSITIEDAAIASTIEYKYRINGNWDTSEFPDGGPNRTYIVRYFNNLDDIYNDGQTTGVEVIKLKESMSVYPNPNSGRFTVDFYTPLRQSISVTLMNIQGQEVFSKTVKGANKYKEAVHENLQPGVYFLMVKTQSGVKTQKVIIN